MFQKTTLFIGDEISQIEFEENKTYLLYVAQNCEIKKMVMNHLSTIYTVVFPAVIYGNKLYENGVLVCELKKETTIAHCACEKDSEKESHKEILTKSKSVLLFVHWLDPRIYQYLDRIFSFTSEDVSIIGAGCGRTSMDGHSVMTHNSVPLQEGFLVLFSTQTLNIGLKHGASFYNGYYIAHAQEGGKITTINGERAAPFYAKLVQKYFNEVVTPENIFSIGLKYPIGLGATRGEQPLRVPVAIEGESLIVAGPMDAENTISLMYIDNETILKASSLAINEAKEGLHNLEDKTCFIIECAGRKTVLGEDLFQELDNIISNFPPSTQCYGVLSLGEIANRSDKYIEYSNEACAIGVF